MNLKQTSEYIESLVPEIEAAIAAVYAPDKTYLNTKHIALEIQENPSQYPKLGRRDRKHIKDAITTYLQSKKGLVSFSAGSRRRGGRIFYRGNSIPLTQPTT